MSSQFVPPMMTTPLNISVLTIEIKKVLGSGGYGTVYLLEIRMSNQQVYKFALKELRCMVSEQMQQAQEEMTIMKGLNHANIVKFYAGYQLKDKTLLLLEYCDGGNLRYFLQKNIAINAGFIVSTVSRDVIYKFAFQIATALYYLHQNNIVHKDIKPENLLLTSDGNIKVTDFGISRVLNPNFFAITNRGTPLYIAPEIFNNQPYTEKVDSWSFGTVLQELMYGYSNYGPQPNLPNYPDVNLRILVSNLLIDDEKRWSMNQALTMLQVGVNPSVPGIPVLPSGGVIPLPSAKDVFCALGNYYQKLYALHNITMGH